MRKMFSMEADYALRTMRRQCQMHDRGGYASRMRTSNERLKLARERAGYATASDAARAFGWTESTYLGHENGTRGLKPKVAERYARALRVTPEWLLFDDGQDPEAAEARAPSKAPPSQVDVYNVMASAGFGAVAENEMVVERLSFPPGYLGTITRTHPRHLRIIGVKGESMEPTLKDDDVVMLDTTKTSLDFDGLFVLRFGDALHVKRIGRASKGMVLVISDNDAYRDVELPREEVEVIGKVVWLGKRA